MAKLSLNQAAKYAGVAKKTLLERLRSNDLNEKVSGEKNAQGHWEIDEAELDRVFRKPQEEPRSKTVSPPPIKATKPSETGALEVEVKMLREQVDTMSAERDRERGQLVDQIEDLRARLDGAEAERVRLNVLLTDQREKSGVRVKRGLWARLVGR
ncbi:hypothetical protein [Leisingera sp. F5]|uniref:hypothetical protein n=1 Tax=Leisingera sp. F5 TaxID=1813816 RepID=UPI000AB4E53F|nr:hypothetical protein [Leisingera sp. F5]